MTVPPFVYVKAFWQFLSYIVAGILGLLYVFGKIPAAYVVDAGVVLTLFLGVLKFFQIEPQVRMKEQIAALKAQPLKKAKGK